MLAFINTAVIFVFGFVITGIVFLGTVRMREQAMRAARVEANRGRERGTTSRSSAEADRG